MDNINQEIRRLSAESRKLSRKIRSGKATPEERSQFDVLTTLRNAHIDNLPKTPQKPGWWNLPLAESCWKSAGKAIER